MRRLIPLLFPLAIACGPVPQLGDYDQSCEMDDDCVVAFLHRDCDCGVIGAVNVSQRPRVDRDNDAARAQEWCPGGVTECDVAPMKAVCEAGTCRARVDEAIYNGAVFPDMSTDMSSEDMSVEAD